MTFAEFGNAAADAAYAGGGANKVAEIVTFPQITGRDAPGKTGSAAKPALLKELGLTVVSSTSARVIYSVWNSDGTNPYIANPFVIPDNFGTNKVVELPDPGRKVFSGVGYYVGFVGFDGANEDGSTPYGWGIVTGTPRAKLDRNRGGANFIDQGSAGPGSLNYKLFYNVLPTQPLNLTGSISGPTETNVSLNWDAVASDGGEAVDGYRIQLSTDNVNWVFVRADTANTERSRTVRDLVPGVTYYFRVAALNLVSRTHGADYSSPYSATFSIQIPGAVAGNAESLLTVTVADPEPAPVVFSDSGNGIRFKSVDVEYGSEYLYNEVQATTQDNSAITQTIDAPLSKALFGTRTYSITSLLSASDAEALAVAKDYLSYYYQPELRIQGVVIDMLTLSIEDRVKVLDLEIDDFISVSFTPNGIGDPKISSGLVTGITHRVSITTHEVELRLRNQSTLFTLDSDSKGILDVNLLGP
jgi:hypothetical protein